MTITAIIQARMGSSRLPGKVLADVGGVPMLALMLRRLSGLPVDNLVVATTSAARDAPIADVAGAAGADVFRGSEDDVLARMVGALDAYPADDVVRMTADCPLSDVAVVSDVLDVHRTVGAHYTSNTLLRTYPDGLDVEVVRADVLRAAADCADDPAEREHVTPWVYRHPERHVLAAHRSLLDAGEERWTVDTAGDLARLRRMVAAIEDPVGAAWTQILRAWGRHAQVGPFRLRPAGFEDADLILRWRNDPESIRFSPTGAVSAEAHAEWMVAHVDRPASRVWIGLLDGVAVGQARIDVVDATGVVAITVDARRRNQGLGTRLVRGLLAKVSEDLQVTRLHAEVHPDNHPSARVFERCGFIKIGSGDYDRFEWVR